MISLPFVLALIVLLFIAWGASLAVSYPYDGILGFRSNGLITEIAPNGPSFKKLEEGDVILSVNGRPIGEAVPFYRDYRYKEAIIFEVMRDDQKTSVPISPIRPSSVEITSRLVTSLVGLIFCLVGVAVLTFKPSDSAATTFFFFCMVTAVLLTAGGISYSAPPVISSLFSSFLWIIGPLSVHFHLYFPQVTTIEWRRRVIWLYLVGLLGGFVTLIIGQTIFRASPWYPNLRTALLLFLALNILLVVGLLVFSYQHAITPGARGKIRIVVLGGVLSALPVVMLTILPDALTGNLLLPYTYGFLFLSIIPLTYGYAIFRYRLIEIDKNVNRGATYILVFSILVGFYLILYTIQQRLLVFLVNEPVTKMILVLVLAGVLVPLYRFVQKIVDIIFYGSWYDYRSAVKQITQDLEQITDLQVLAHTIGDRLVKTLRLEDACIFLRDHKGDFSVIEVAPREGLDNRAAQSLAVLPRTSLTFLLKVGAVERNTLLNALAETPLTLQEQQLLDSEQAHLWVPVIGHGQVLGQFALGPKLGGDVYSGEDLDILRVVALQAGSMIENVHLLMELRQYAAELEQRVEERTGELHAEKERVEAILFSVGEGVFVMDLYGKILTVNNAFISQSGYDASELSGLQFFDLFEGHNAPGSGEAGSKLSLGDSVWSQETVARRINGSTYPIQLTVAPIRNQDGEIIGYVGSQRDITEQKKLDRLKDQFILEVSHQLRTPITNISLYLDLLQRGKPDRRADYQYTLQAEVSQLSKMIEEILDLSRLAIRKYKKEDFQPVDINLLVEQILPTYRHLDPSGAREILFKPAEGLPLIQGEQNQIVRLIHNLLTNAINYTPSGIIQVSTYQTAERCYLEVKDSGIGISEEDLPYLFTRFYRGRNASQLTQGSGLGLAIVKEIATLHGGGVEVESEEGRGSTFRVWFPALSVTSELKVASSAHVSE